ncbi:MAG: hypothetical protein R3E53_08960 [Myxococcota bacterium]
MTPSRRRGLASLRGDEGRAQSPDPRLAAELADGIAVNLVAPVPPRSAPWRRRGTSAITTERMEYLTEQGHEMCRLPAKERTGLLACSPLRAPDGPAPLDPDGRGAAWA